MQEGLFSFSAERYHADPCEVPSLSASIAHVINNQSPLHAYTVHPRLGGVPRPPKKAFDIGSLSHALLLGNGKEVAIIDARNYNTKAAQSARDEARASGQIPVLAAAYKEAVETADTLRQRFSDYDIILSGDSEVTALWAEVALDGTEVQCRGMMDHITPTGIYDLKSIYSAHPDVCRRHVASYGYDIQRAAYVSAIAKLKPETAGRTDFVFVFYELEPPFAVTPIRLSGAFRELGERRWRRSVNTWAMCMRENRWPAYVESITEIEPMPWALANDMERQIQSANWLDDLPM